MATNFKIHMKSDRDSVLIRLSGDFDGSSALELLHMLSLRCNGKRKVIIHTGALGEIHPFGRDTFLNNLSRLNGKSIHLRFEGEKSAQITQTQMR
jgi:anti-anti-sigma regulatory factor